jgi:hypothetical protein
MVTFLFWGSASCCVCFTKVIGRTEFATTVQDVYFSYIRPLHVSALNGHLQAEHAILYKVTTPTTDPSYFVTNLMACEHFNI